MTVVGAGVSGLCDSYELKKAGCTVTTESSSRVGGRVKTFAVLTFAPGFHGDGGALHIPANLYLLHQYVDDFGLKDDRIDYEMKNKFVYISGYGEKTTHEKFNSLLLDGGKSEDSKRRLRPFPGLWEEEKGQTCDQLFACAVFQVVEGFWRAYDRLEPEGKLKEKKIEVTYYEITVCDHSLLGKRTGARTQPTSTISETPRWFLRMALSSLLKTPLCLVTIRGIIGGHKVAPIRHGRHSERI